VQWETDRRADATVDFGTSPTALGLQQADSDASLVHEVDLGDLQPGRRYYYRVTSTTPWGTTASSSTRSFDMPAYGVADSRGAQWQLGDRAAVAVAQRGDGELRLAAGQTDGLYRSRLLDIDQMVNWRSMVVDADVPSGTSVTVHVRTGSTSTPDASWTDWTAVTAGALPATVRSSRYVQYRVRLRSSGAATPVVRAIGFTSSGVLVRPPTETGE
jgi:hypothetical protein